MWDVGDNIVITANGYSADGETLAKRLSQRIEVRPNPSNPKTKRESGTTMRIIVKLQYLLSLGLLKPSFMENDFSHIMSIRLLLVLMRRGKVLCMHLIQSEVMNDYNVVQVVQQQVLSCHSLIIRFA